VLSQRLNDLLTTPRPEFLATREEQAILARLEELESQLDASSGADAGLLARIQRLKGRLTWTLETEYHERLTEFDSHLRELNGAMAVLDSQHRQYIRARQAATHSFEGYESPIQQLRAHVGNSVDKVDRLMAQQGRMLEAVAIEELVARRQRLEIYRDKARYALADSYDRATQAQASADPRR
jgi:chromosome segregation ATPase